MTERQLRFRLGIFAVLTLVLLGTLILLFGSLPTFFKRSNTYTVRFADAPGLRPGSPVHRSGVRIGEVTNLALNDESGKVFVNIEVEQNYTVRQSEVPTLVIGLLGNDASIDFLPKPPPKGQEVDRSPIPPGSEIDGAQQVSVSALLNRASDVVPTTQDTLNDLRKSMKRLEEMAPLMERTMRQYEKLGQNLNDQAPLVEETLREYRNLGRTANKEFPDLAKSLRGTSDDVGAVAREYRRLGENLNVFFQGNEDKFAKIIDSLQKSLASFNYTLDRVGLLLTDENIKSVAAIIKNLSEVMDQAPAIAKNVKESSESLPSIAKNTDELVKESRQTLQRLQQTLTKAEAAMADIQKTTQLIGERGPAITKNLDESFDKLNRTLTDVRELMRVIGQSDGTFKRILTDPSLYNNVDQATCAIVKMLPRLDRILKDLETFADELARHPEKLGIRGAISPSDGLKEPSKIGVTPH